MRLYDVLHRLRHVRHLHKVSVVLLQHWDRRLEGVGPLNSKERETTMALHGEEPLQLRSTEGFCLKQLLFLLGEGGKLLLPQRCGLIDRLLFAGDVALQVLLQWRASRLQRFCLRSYW